MTSNIEKKKNEFFNLIKEEKNIYYTVEKAITLL